MKWPIAVLAVGLFAAGPFLTSRALGTREAYNYSLATADAVSQFRAGELPVLAGQTEFAFNGRVHPLRTAPGLVHVAGLLDLLTFRQLGFWTLQNLVLALSLLGGALACYWALRRWTPAPPSAAALLAALYILCPAVLAAAYGMDLYMTVLAVPCVPLVIGASTGCLRDPARADLPLLAVALAGCWLAHPPVALWLSIATVLLQAAALALCRPDRRSLPRFALAAGLFAACAGFGFVSALSVSPYGSIVHERDTSLLLSEVQRVFPATLRPVSSRADRLGDFQAGYAVWTLAMLGLALALARRAAVPLVLLAVAAFLLLFTVPVPLAHRWLWEHVPTLVVNLTNQWPMQRLYLPCAALVLFASALAGKLPDIKGRLAQDALRLLALALLGWTLWQGWRFIARGYDTRQSAGATARSHLSSNLDLTPISYAIVGTPPDFTNGVMDPAFGFRLLAPHDARLLVSNWTAPLPPADRGRTLQLHALAGETGDVLNLPGELRLEPGRRYRLTFEFLAPAQPATLQITGPALRREYALPSAGGPRGFGQQAGNNQALTLWTDQPVPEDIRFRLVGPGLARSALRGRPFAKVQVDIASPDHLPIGLLSLLPLRCRVSAPAAGYLETPRSFIHGYQATVNGESVRVQSSPDRLAMLPVPAGESRVELRYAGSPLLHWSFWLACAGWGAVAAWSLARCAPAGRRESLQRAAAEAGRRIAASLAATPRTVRLAAAGLVLFGAGASVAWQEWSEHRAAVGPVRVRFVLPRGETGRQQPLLVTGKPHAGMFIYAVYSDPEHIRIGADVWGVMGVQTGPIRVDYFAGHEITVDAGALYPEGHGALRNLPADALARLRNRLRVALDGRTVIERDVSTFDSRPGEITAGLNRIGGSSCEPAFAGQILSVERLPVPSGEPR